MCQYVWTTWSLCMELPNHARLLAVTFCNDVLHTLPEDERPRFEGTHQVGTAKMPKRIKEFTWACRRKIETLKTQTRTATCPACFNEDVLEDRDVLGPWLDLDELPLAGVISTRDYWRQLLRQPEFHFLWFVDMPNLENDVTLTSPAPQTLSLDEPAKSDDAAAEPPQRREIPQPPRPYTPLHLQPAEEENEE
ncbi:hypothetical protein MAPG_10878 [Magnaporthiopsis poae ATCC 64411]|uniref:Uncharacterized protein n=1 Tax=Magnaporthiopsis poae (strain ATCC 64411 / 73-15) TaxID=644358 RepID=A0A0C4EDR9_MAGP6|nr:hypothetical protein MAPG_10878 [Magnaporthiopsis poae ATCC 64411]